MAETAAANSGRVYRMLDAPLVVDDNTTGIRYLSFLFQSGQETGATIYQMLALKNSNTTDIAPATSTSASATMAADRDGV